MQAEGRAPLTGDTTDPEPGTDPDQGSAHDPAAEPVDAPGPHRHRRVGLLLAVAVLVVALDQLTKALVVARLADREPLRLLGGLLTLTYTRNAGAAFSLGTGFTLLFTAVAVTVVVVILRVSRRLYSIGWAVALGALLGGAIGNLVDRLTRSPGVGRGHVVDWIQLPHFAVFNLADAAITCSAVAMVLLSATGHDVDGTRHRHVDG
jgi:lipoprotein signal peptidase